MKTIKSTTDQLTPSARNMKKNPQIHITIKLLIIKNQQ